MQLNFFNQIFRAVNNLQLTDDGLIESNWDQVAEAFEEMNLKPGV